MVSNPSTLIFSHLYAEKLIFCFKKTIINEKEAVDGPLKKGNGIWQNPDHPFESTSPREKVLRKTDPEMNVNQA